MSISTAPTAAAPRIDLVFDNDCPNVEDARALLRRALGAAGLALMWQEWERDAAETPAALRGLGSPTILVDGVDVSGAEAPVSPSERANCCRVYENGGRLRGIPAAETVATALSRRRTGT
jgi:mercuric ion transport protein